LNTGILVPIRFWNKKLSRISKELPKNYGNSDDLNEELGLMVRKAEDIVSFAIKKHINDPLNFLKNTFHPNFNVCRLEDKVEEAESSEQKLIIKLVWICICRSMITANQKKKKYVKTCHVFTEI